MYEKNSYFGVNTMMFVLRAPNLNQRFDALISVVGSATHLAISPLLPDALKIIVGNMY